MLLIYDFNRLSHIIIIINSNGDRFDFDLNGRMTIKSEIGTRNKSYHSAGEHFYFLFFLSLISIIFCLPPTNVIALFFSHSHTIFCSQIFSRRRQIIKTCSFFPNEFQVDRRHCSIEAFRRNRNEINVNRTWNISPCTLVPCMGAQEAEKWKNNIININVCDDYFWDLR